MKQKEFWIKYKWDKDGNKSLYSEKLNNNDIFRLPHKSRADAESWIKIIADGRNLFRNDFYIEEIVA